MINTYADLGMPAEIPGSDKVVFGLVASENGFRVMGYDIPGLTECGGATRREKGTTVTEQAVFVSISAPTVGELQSHRGALAASLWCAGFGLLTDRFGVAWSISTDAV